jgi:hypothetical protein
MTMSELKAPFRFPVYIHPTDVLYMAIEDVGSRSKSERIRVLANYGIIYESLNLGAFNDHASELMIYPPDQYHVDEHHPKSIFRFPINIDPKMDPMLYRAIEDVGERGMSPRLRELAGYGLRYESLLLSKSVNEVLGSARVAMAKSTL